MIIKNITFSRTDIASILLITFFITLIRTAWIGDDAIFTFRSILNLLSGYGPNFNISERVQSYTHPLWFLLLTALTLITKNTFTSAYAASLVLSLTSYWLLVTNKKANFYGAIIAGLSLLLSKAFVDYSTSGLENPLTNLLLLLTVLSFCKAIQEKSDRYNASFFICISLVYLTRSDAIIFLFPVICFYVYYSRNKVKKLIPGVSLGLLIFSIWNIFSLFYYGSLFPNTAYAKLSTGIPLEQMLSQGLMYFIDSIGSDPITIIVILIGIFSGFYSVNNKPIAMGITLYLIYILYIGGDFMSGRFFATPIFLAAYILSTNTYSKKNICLLISVILILGLLNIKNTLLSNQTYGEKFVPPSGITDERGYYYGKSGLLNLSRQNFEAIHWPKGMKQNGDPKVLCSPALTTIDHTHPIDSHFIIGCALADPLLSRLPINLKDGWRIGHYDRKLPNGYKASVATDSNQITDPIIRPIYDSLSIITKGNLWDISRLEAIFLLNFTDKFNPTQSFLKNGIKFNQEPFTYFVTNAEGLSGREDWGRWSDTTGNQSVLIELLVLLPKKFTLVIEAKGFDQNIGQVATIIIGNNRKTIILDKEITRYEIPFDVSERSSVIKIIPPKPISPSEIDINNTDKRNLGIGIKSIAFLN